MHRKNQIHGKQSSSQSFADQIFLLASSGNVLAASILISKMKYLSTEKIKQHYTIKGKTRKHLHMDHFSFFGAETNPLKLAQLYLISGYLSNHLIDPALQVNSQLEDIKPMSPNTLVPFCRYWSITGDIKSTLNFLEYNFKEHGITPGFESLYIIYAGLIRTFMRTSTDQDAHHLVHSFVSKLTQVVPTIDNSALYNSILAVHCDFYLDPEKLFLHFLDCTQIRSFVTQVTYQIIHQYYMRMGSEYDKKRKAVEAEMMNFYLPKYCQTLEFLDYVQKMDYLSNKLKMVDCE
jgi:hypothetical protein